MRTTPSLGVEKMMQATTAALAWCGGSTDHLLQRFEEQFDGEAVPEALGEGFSLRRSYLAANDRRWPAGDVLQVFALFASWAATAKCAACHSPPALAEYLPRLPAD